MQQHTTAAIATILYRSCPRCNEPFPASEFPLLRNGQPYQYCRSCRQAYNRAYYEKNKLSVRARETRRERKESVRQWLHAYQEATPCADCAGHFHFAATALIGLPQINDLRILSNGRDGKKSVEEELRRHKLLCANCRAIRKFTSAT